MASHGSQRAMSMQPAAMTEEVETTVEGVELEKGMVSAKDPIKRFRVPE